VLGAGHGKTLPSPPLYAFSLPEPRGDCPPFAGHSHRSRTILSSGSPRSRGALWHERCYIEDVESPETGGES
jgi:hypothetical protein